MRKVLITGGAGMIGRRLAELLAPRCELIVFDSFERSSVSFEMLSKLVPCVRGDIRDREALMQAMSGCDAVFHLAAYGSVVESIANPRDNFNSNVLGTLSVLDAARESDVTKFIFSSTGGAIMGNTPPPVDEGSVPAPISPYGASKLCCEGYLSAYAASYGIDTTIFRFGNVYGPYSAHKKGAITNFIKAAMQGNDIIIFGDGGATRDFVYVDDLCHGLISGLGSSLGGCNTYHLASGVGTTIASLASSITSLVPNDKTRIIFKDKRAGEVVHNFADFSKANRELGFRPKVSLSDGLKLTVDWFTTLSDSDLNQATSDS